MNDLRAINRRASSIFQIIITRILAMIIIPPQIVEIQPSDHALRSVPRGVGDQGRAADETSAVGARKVLQISRPPALLLRRCSFFVVADDRRRILHRRIWWLVQVVFVCVFLDMIIMEKGVYISCWGCEFGEIRVPTMWNLEMGPQELR